MDKRQRKPTVWPIALAAIGVLLLSVSVASSPAVWEELFPPKPTSVMLEGETENVTYEAAGHLPTDGPEAAPGFVIYYDTERYVMSEEEGVTYIRFVTDAQLPPCEVEIRHVPGVLPDAAAADTRAQQLPLWDGVSEIEAVTQPDGLCFLLSSGMNWDSAREEIYFISDGSTGTFRIHVRYFLEAAEGHGARFRQMLQTFTVLPGGH